MSDADELFRAGDIDGARLALIEAVKRAPTDQPTRMFLFQLFCLTGEWERAQTQLRTVAQLSPEAQMLAVTYSMAIASEQARAEAFAGSAPPVLLVSSPWAGDLVASLSALTQGKLDEAESLRERAFDAAPDTPGELDGVAFDWIADADARFGPSLEAIINGRWGILPFDAVEKIVTDGPKDLRDLVWIPAQISFKSGSSVNAMLPARYPGSETAGDSALRLTRGTAWIDQPWGQAGLGQHEWSLSTGDEVGILSFQKMTFK